MDVALSPGVLQPHGPSIKLPSFKETFAALRGLLKMGDMTNTEESNYLSYRFKGGTMTALANSYVGLFSTSPTEAGTGGVELTAGTAPGYARLVMAQADWGAVSAGEPSLISNSAQKNFVAASADWPTVVAIGLFDASTAGNLLYFKVLGTSKTVNNGDTAKFNAGALQVGVG